MPGSLSGKIPEYMVEEEKAEHGQAAGGRWRTGGNNKKTKRKKADEEEESNAMRKATAMTARMAWQNAGAPAQHTYLRTTGRMIDSDLTEHSPALLPLLPFSVGGWLDGGPVMTHCA